MKIAFSIMGGISATAAAFISVCNAQLAEMQAWQVPPSSPLADTATAVVVVIVIGLIICSCRRLL